MAKVWRVLCTWEQISARPWYIQRRWAELALDAWANKANEIWHVTPQELRQAAEWYLDQGEKRNVPYIGLAEAFLDENAEQEQDHANSPP